MKRWTDANANTYPNDEGFERALIPNERKRLNEYLAVKGSEFVCDLNQNCSVWPMGSPCQA